MHFLSSTVSNGATEREFLLNGVPGILWTPLDTAAPSPLVLLAHGGGQHKRAPSVVSRAALCVAAGLAAVAIDAPGHGDREQSAEDARVAVEIRSRITAGEPVAALVTEHNAGLARQAVPEWRSVVDALLERPEIGGPNGGALGDADGGRDGGALNDPDGGPNGGAPSEPDGDPEGEPVGGIVGGANGGPADGAVDGSVGFWGVSMGAAIGIRVAAAESRVRAAVLGLVGGEGVARVAAEVTVPVRFLLQWDDQLVAREDGLAVFDAFGSREKTLHANPGGHGEVPESEADSAVGFLAKHLVRRTG